MVYVQPSFYPGEWDTQNSLGCWDTNGSPNLVQMTILYNNQQKKRSCKIVDLTVPANHWEKWKENEKKDKYLDLAWELKKLCPWYSHQRIGKRTRGLGNKRTSGDNPNYSIIEIDQILRRVLETWGDLFLLRLQWKTISERWCGKLSRNKIITRLGGKFLFSTITVLITRV